MKFTETIEELEDLIRTYERELKEGFCGETRMSPKIIKYNKEAITNMACAIEVLKNNED